MVCIIKYRSRSNYNFNFFFESFKNTFVSEIFLFSNHMEWNDFIPKKYNISLKPWFYTLRKQRRSNEKEKINGGQKEEQ